MSRRTMLSRAAIASSVLALAQGKRACSRWHGVEAGMRRVPEPKWTCCWLLAFSVSFDLQPSVRTAVENRYDPVVNGILAAWGSADVVCLGEDHGRRHDSDLRLALVRHPKFASVVDVIVVEMANNAHQALLDKFILDGAVMSRDEIAPVWRDASGAEVWESPIYEEFLRAIREVNLKVPRDRRVRVIGGDTAVDWTRITRAEDLVPLLKAGLRNRGGNIRRIIAEQVLDKKLRALAIYGSLHCIKVGMGFPGELKDKYPGRMWSVSALAGDAAARAQKTFGLGDEPTYVVTTGTKWESEGAAGILPAFRGETYGQMGDAIGFLGLIPDVVVKADVNDLQTKYGSELARRRNLLEAAETLLRR